MGAPRTPEETPSPDAVVVRPGERGPGILAIIPKNNIDEIRVMWSEYKGRRYLDIRVYTEIDGKADKVPTKKGVTLRPDLIPELREALERAEADGVLA